MAENGVHKPRLCKVVKGPDGYGFHLHGEKGKVGQRIRKVEEGSAAEKAGLLVGDRIICVNGHNVEKESHQDVVKRIKEKENETELLIIDEESEKYFKEKSIPITLDLITNGTDTDGQTSESPKQDKGLESHKEQATTPNSHSQTTSGDSSHELRPRLCELQKDSGGYGFNLHSEKGKPGRYIRSVDPGTPAENAGVKAGDRIIEVNGVNMEFEKHAKLVTAIKESGDSVTLLVVDDETDKYFQSCEVTPSQIHLTGALPIPKPPKAENPQSVDILTMDLTMLKERSRSSKKKKAPTSNWENRRAMFNDL